MSTTIRAAAKAAGAGILSALLCVQAAFALDAQSEVETIPVPPSEPRPPMADPEDAPVELETVTVTGEKLGRSLAETVSSVVAITHEEIQASSGASMKDLVSQFANVVSAGGDREIAIRGVPQSGIGGVGETISVYLDGVALPARAAAFAGPLSAWDLNQVEILRGAQSTNQGRNSLAGSVVVNTAAPTERWDLKLRAGLMSRDGHDYALAAGGPLGAGFGFRIAGQDRYDNGDIVNVTRDEDDAGRELTRNWRLRLGFVPGELPGYSAQYSYVEADNEFGDSLHDSSQGERTETANVRTSEDDRTRLHSLQQTVRFGERWRVESISGWTDIDNLYTIDYDRSADEGGYSDNTLYERTLSQELRLHFQVRRINAVIGAYYADTDRDTSTIGHDVTAAGGLVLLNGYVDAESRQRTQALFGEADWDFATRWRLTAGLRFNQERSRDHGESDLSLTLSGTIPGVPVSLPVGVPLPDAVSDGLALLLPDFIPPDYEVSNNTEFTDLLPKLGLTWFLSEASSLALIYQEGYRSGGTSISFFGGAMSPFDPEYTKTLELAARTRQFGGRLMLSANAFYTRWRDQQVTIGESSGFETTTENAGRSHYYGLETEARWMISGPLELNASLGWLESEFDEFVNDGEDYAGNEFPYAPNLTAGLSLTLYEWHRLSGQIALTHIGEAYSDADNDPRTLADARTLLSAKLGCRLGAGFSLSVYGRNLSDDPNVQGTLVSGSDENARVATRYGEPRSWGLLLEWQRP